MAKSDKPKAAKAAPSSSPPAPGRASDAMESLQAKFPFHKRFVRRKVQVRIEVERLSDAINSSTVNISPSGLCFLSWSQLEESEGMRVLIYVPRGKEVELLKVRARVVWQQSRDGQWFVGAAFEQFAPGDERRLRAWLVELGQKVEPPPAGVSPMSGSPSAPGKS